MDFIEKWFHVSPDGGSGSLEVVYLVAVSVVLVAVVRLRGQIRTLVSRAASGVARGRHFGRRIS